MPTSRHVVAAGRALARSYRWVRPVLLLLAGGFAATISLVLALVLLVPYDADALAPEAGGPLLLTDRDGQVLRSVPSDDGRPGREDWIPLQEIPSHVVLAVVASEDEHFYEHGGVDARGIARAAWLNLRQRRLGYGGSTITMQLARMVHASSGDRGLLDKLRESVIAMRMERAMSKREILEQYLNRAYYGNGAYGIEAAARTYFDKPATSLSVAEATFVAVLPRAPTAYDPIRRPGAAKRRRDYVLGLLVRRGLMSSLEMERARAQHLDIRHQRPPDRARHFTEYVLANLPEDVRARGGMVTTSLDLRLQEQLERRVAGHIDHLAKRNLDHAGAVVLDTETGQILAMVGSAGWEREGGQLNITTRRRHPGSALKPFVYALAIEDGDSPASIAHDIHDVPSRYRVVNLTQPERGPVRYREALAGSYNLAAVHTLERVGVPRLMSLLRRAGIGPLDGRPQDYGLRLALGSAKVRLLDLAAGYRFLVRDGRVRAPSAVLATKRPDGRVEHPRPTVERQILSPQTSWQVMDMLADADARRRVFGHELPLDLPFPVAAKTGTSRGFADTVAIAATNEVIVAAWAGNFDGEPTQGLVAMESAAPIVRAGLLAVAGNGSLSLPDRPRGVTSSYVCASSGAIAGADCPHNVLEHFTDGHAPAHTCDWHARENDAVVVRYPLEARPWARRQRRQGGRSPR